MYNRRWYALRLFNCQFDEFVFRSSFAIRVYSIIVRRQSSHNLCFWPNMPDIYSPDLTIYFYEFVFIVSSVLFTDFAAIQFIRPWAIGWNKETENKQKSKNEDAIERKRWCVPGRSPNNRFPIYTFIYLAIGKAFYERRSVDSLDKIKPQIVANVVTGRASATTITTILVHSCVSVSSRRQQKCVYSTVHTQA